MLKVEEDIKLDFNDVLIKPKWSPNASRKDVVLDREFKFYHSKRTFRGFPLIASNMDTTGTFAMSKVLPTCIHKHYSNIELLNWYASLSEHSIHFISTGITKDDFEKLYNLLESIGTDYILPDICIDVANGYSNVFTDAIKRLRDRIGYEPIILAGNVCTPEMVHRIIEAGADIVKVGIGPGSVCKTRMVTGVGFPQLSAIAECADAAHGLKSREKRLGLICADGGCKTPGDVCKAFAANADFVMLGGMLAGTDECEGEWNFSIENASRKESLKFYGMASKEAADKYNGGLKDYRASEGECITVPYKGPALDIISEIQGGLRSCCTYVGATCLKDLAKCSSFIRVNRIK